MSMCKYGKLKNKVKGRVCKKRFHYKKKKSRKRSKSRRKKKSRKRSRKSRRKSRKQQCRGCGY